MTGPVYVKGAEPGDLLEIECLDVIPELVGWTRIGPGMGFLKDLFLDPYLVHWSIADGWATSEMLPGVRIPYGAFMGTAGVAPSHSQLDEWTRREAELMDRGGVVMPPDPTDAVPAGGAVAEHGLRTLPPRENGGNADVKQLTKGSRLFVPCGCRGRALFGGGRSLRPGRRRSLRNGYRNGGYASRSVPSAQGRGDAAQCTMAAILPYAGYFQPPEWAAPRRFIATMGMPVTDDGENRGEDLTLAARNALLNMIDLLQERGWSREQAYAICSVAVDLKVSNVVDVPNFVVSAFLPEDIFG